MRFVFFIALCRFHRQAGSATSILPHSHHHAVKRIPEISKPGWSRAVIDGVGSRPPSVPLGPLQRGSTRERTTGTGQVTRSRTDGGRPRLPLCLFLSLSLSFSFAPLSLFVFLWAQILPFNSSSRQGTCGILRKQAGFTAGSRTRSPCSCK